MKIKCPNCNETIVLDINEHEEGDEVECSECGERYLVTVNEGKFRLITEKEKFFEEEGEEFEEDFD
jgi:DNA-directed RNA polymerase subunit RPC12/RpoP